MQKGKLSTSEFMRSYWPPGCEKGKFSSNRLKLTNLAKQVCNERGISLEKRADEEGLECNVFEREVLSAALTILKGEKK